MATTEPKAPAPKAPAAPKVEAPKVEAPKVKSSTIFDVKNITNRTLYLANGVIEKGQIGKATAAECSALFVYIEKVD